MKFECTIDEHIGPILYIQIRNQEYGLCFCHQRKDRSIRFFGLEKYLCSRCLGLFIGGIFGMLLVWTHFAIPPVGLVLLMMPMLIDGFLQLFNYRESNNFFRLITGFGFGLSIPLVIDFLFSYML